MATDFAYAAFLFPVLLCIVVFLCLAVGKPATFAETTFLGLGRVRLARGYLGAILGALISAAISATELGFNKVALGHISNTELRQLLPGYILYFFVLSVPFALAALTFVGLPVLATLRRFRAMTVIWASVAALLFSVALGIFTMRNPYNQWCTTHLIECGAKSVFSTMLLALPVVFGFALAAKISWRRNTQAN